MSSSSSASLSGEAGASAGFGVRAVGASRSGAAISIDIEYLSSRRLCCGFAVSRAAASQPAERAFVF
jgi:hypothetical protein